MYWQNLTSPALDQMDRSTPVVLPIAAIEQHGPHLPLATDRLIGEHFCRALDQLVPDQVLILPTVAVGFSRHHRDFIGTLTLTHQTFIDEVCEILECVADDGFRNIVVLNSHGGNIGAAQVILERFGAAHPDCQVVAATWWRIAADQLLGVTESDLGGVGHACEFETSLMEVIAPELIDRRFLQPGQNVPTYAWAEGDMLRGAKAALYRSMKQMTPNGVFGRPDLASREKGQAIERVVVAELQAIVLSLAKWKDR